MVPVIVARAELLLDQEPAETGAVDEQLASKRSTVGKRDRPDMAALPIHGHVNDLALDALGSVPFGVRPEEARIETRIEVEGVSNLRQGHRRLRARPGEAAKFGCDPT